MLTLKFLNICLKLLLGGKKNFNLSPFVIFVILLVILGQIVLSLGAFSSQVPFHPRCLFIFTAKDSCCMGEKGAKDLIVFSFVLYFNSFFLKQDSLCLISYLLLESCFLASASFFHAFILVVYFYLVVQSLFYLFFKINK